MEMISPRLREVIAKATGKETTAQEEEQSPPEGSDNSQAES